MRYLLTSLIVFTFIAASEARSQCIKPNSETVTLQGIVFAKDFPGPPNYQSIRSGDERVRYWILHLDKLICVRPDTDDDRGLPNVKTRDIQLVFMDDSFYTKYRDLVRRRARFNVVGSLFHQNTVHHVTKILVNVKTFSPIGK